MVTGVVEVDAVDEADLRAFAEKASEGSSSVIETRALDGATVFAAVIGLTAPSIALLQAWLIARVNQRKRTSVQLNGRTYRAYSSKDVIKLERALRALEADDGGQDSQD